MADRKDLLKLCDNLIEQESRNPVSRTVRYDDVWVVAKALRDRLSPAHGDVKEGESYIDEEWQS